MTLKRDATTIVQSLSSRRGYSDEEKDGVHSSVRVSTVRPLHREGNLHGEEWVCRLTNESENLGHSVGETLGEDDKDEIDSGNGKQYT